MKPVTTLVCLALVLACLGGAASARSDRLDIDNDGNGRFSGHAGPAWTEDQLRQQVGAKVCGGALPREFILRVLSGYWLFSGTC